MRVRTAQALAAAACVLALVAMTAPARADFTVCNQTGSQVGVAIGYQSDADWATEGWWNLAPGACEAILPGPLNGRFYYVFARDWDTGGDWGGTTPMCTQKLVFTINGVTDCASRGYEISDFFEIDTGNEDSWTVRLSDPGT